MKGSAKGSARSSSSGAAGQPWLPAALRAIDLFEFARHGSQAFGSLVVSDLPRMATEVPYDAPARDDALKWQAQGELHAEFDSDAPAARQPFLSLQVAGTVWLACQRCLRPYEQVLAVDTLYRIVSTEADADAAPLDDDEADVIVGSRQFDLLDLLDEELVLSLPLVPKHAVCPAVHESLISGADGAAAPQSADAAAAAEADAQSDVQRHGSGKSAFAGLAALKIDKKI